MVCLRKKDSGMFNKNRFLQLKKLPNQYGLISIYRVFFVLFSLNLLKRVQVLWVCFLEPTIGFGSKVFFSEISGEDFGTRNFWCCLWNQKGFWKSLEPEISGENFGTRNFW